MLSRATTKLLRAIGGVVSRRSKLARVALAVHPRPNALMDVDADLLEQLD